MSDLVQEISSVKNIQNVTMVLKKSWYQKRKGQKVSINVYTKPYDYDILNLST